MRRRPLLFGTALVAMVAGAAALVAQVSDEDSRVEAVSDVEGDCVRSQLATSEAPEGWASVTMTPPNGGSVSDGEHDRELWGPRGEEGLRFGGFPPRLTDRAKTIDVEMGAVRYEAPDGGGSDEVHGTIDLDSTRPECTIAFSAGGIGEDDLAALFEGLRYAAPDEQASPDGLVFTFWSLREVIVRGERVSAVGSIALHVDRARFVAIDGCHTLQPAYEQSGETFELTNDLFSSCSDGPAVSEEWDEVTDTLADGEVQIAFDEEVLTITRGSTSLVFERGVDATPAAVEQPPETAALLGTWTADGLDLTCDGCTAPTVTFIDEERIEVNDSCNDLTTTYYFLGKSFYAQEFVGTKRSCPPRGDLGPTGLPTDRRVQQLLQIAARLTVSADTLTLEGNGDRITFTRSSA